jgi:hypothetical protein
MSCFGENKPKQNKALSFSLMERKQHLKPMALAGGWWTELVVLGRVTFCLPRLTKYGIHIFIQMSCTIDPLESANCGLVTHSGPLIHQLVGSCHNFEGDLNNGLAYKLLRIPLLEVAQEGEEYSIFESLSSVNRVFHNFANRIDCLVRV